MKLTQRIATLTDLSKEASEWLDEHIVESTFKKNEWVLKEGKVCESLFYIKSGMLCSIYETEDREICNWLAIENDIATAYYSFISRTPSYESIQCLEDATVEKVNYDILQEFYFLFPETERAGRLILEEYYSRLEERLISIQFKTAKERYQALFANRPEIIKRAPLGRIASYLGITQETLSRIRSDK